MKYHISYHVTTKDKDFFGDAELPDTTINDRETINTVRLSLATALSKDKGVEIQPTDVVILYFRKY